MQTSNNDYSIPRPTLKRKRDDSEENAQTQIKKPRVSLPKATRVVKIQRKNGKVIQDCDVYIGRAYNRGGWHLKASKWANPYKGKNTLPDYRKYVEGKPELMNSLHELEGKVLGCWCKVKPSDPCHGDVLVQLLKEHQKKKEEQKDESDSESS